MNVLAPNLTEDLSYRDVLRLLEATARQLHVIADVVEKDLEGDAPHDGR